MSNRKLAVLIAMFAMLAVPAAAGAQAGRYRAHYRVYRHHCLAMPCRCPLHRTAEGELVDCQGWRLRGGTIGWDNSCFNLDYLPSQFACGSGNGQ